MSTNLLFTEFFIYMYVYESNGWTIRITWGKTQLKDNNIGNIFKIILPLPLIISFTIDIHSFIVLYHSCY